MVTVDGMLAPVVTVKTDVVFQKCFQFSISIDVCLFFCFFGKREDFFSWLVQKLKYHKLSCLISKTRHCNRDHVSIKKLLNPQYV